jgi:hypothetical protein
VDEAEHVLQQRMDDGKQAAVLECVEVILGLPYIDIAQPGLGAVSQVRDHARGDLRAEAVLDAGVHLRGDRDVAGECVGHVRGPPICHVRASRPSHSESRHAPRPN